MRRGEYSKFDAESMLPGEWAVVLESDPNGTGGRSLYMCFSPGVVKRIATVEDMATIIANAESEVSANIMKIATEAKANADAATDAAKAATTAANESKNSADEAAADARKAADEARGSVSSNMKIYFKRVTDAQGNSRPVLVDMTV